MAVHDNERFNFQFSTKCTAVTLIISSIYAVAVLCISLVCRLFLNAYYATAHQTALGVVIFVFIICHHVGRLRHCLRLTARAYCLIQTVLNLIFLNVSIITAISYSYLTSLSIHTNYDDLAASVVAFINALFLVYLTVISILGLKLSLSTQEKRYSKEPTFTDSIELQNQQSKPIGSHSKQDGCLAKPGVWKPVCCILFPFYILLIIILLLVFILTAYNTIGAIDDIKTFRNNSEMVEVNVEGYGPLSLYLHCEGSGTETVVMENGLGGMVFMMWHFIPRLLTQKSIRVCAYDRRGYGWSETFENGNPLNSVRMKQRASNNVQFLHALVKAHNISTPFYYAGHSYGAHHMTYMALLYPDVIKGLIYLDGAGFSPLDTLYVMMELVCNVQHTGLIRAGIATGLLNYTELYKDVIDFKNLPSDLEKLFIASLRSGYFITSFLREKGPLVDSELAGDELEEELKSRSKIDAPVLVIDAGDRSWSWFPSEYFSKYNHTAYQTSIAGTTHQTLVMSMQYAPQVADLIESFIIDQSSNV